MSALLDFLLPALLVSAGALIALRLSERVPPGLSLTFALVGLLAWFVPWQLVESPTASPSAPTSGWLSQGVIQVSWFKHGLGETLEGMASPAPFWWFAVFVPGCLWFAHDAATHLATVRRWRRGGRDAADLSELLAPWFRSKPAIRIVPGVDVAVATGFFTTTIWIGDEISDEEALRVALVHEAVHLRRRDPIWLVLLTLAARLYWFNPIVQSLRRQAVLAIETACDEECARILGRESYRGTLARLVLEHQMRAAPKLVPTLRSTRFDLVRIALLKSGPRMNRSSWAAILLLLASLVFGLGLAAARPPDLRIGEWIEVSNSAHHGYDVVPSMRRFERLANGMTRIYRGPDPYSGDEYGWTDIRCDGGEYLEHDADGRAGPTWSCTAVDPWTNTYVGRSTDGSGLVERSTEIVSRDGETIEVTVSRELAGVRVTTAQTFGRLP